MKVKKPILTAITVILVCALVVLTFLSRTIMTKNQTEVIYVKPERTDILTSRDIVGVVEYNNTYEAVYDIPLKIIDVFVKPGDSVSASKILIEVDCRELALELKKKEFTVLQIKNSIANGASGNLLEELQIQLEIAEEEVALFKEKYPTDGKIRAGSAGTIYSVNAVKGETMERNTSLAALSGKKSAANVVFYLPEYDADFFNEGDSAILYYSEVLNYNNENQAMSVAKNSSITSKQFLLKDNLYKFYVPIQSDFIYHGQQIQVKITNKSPVYEIVVPYEALHKKDDNLYYVYVLKQRNGLFGEEYYPDVVDVNVLYENKVKAAINSLNITKYNSVVTFASDYIIPGKTVRVLN